MREIHDPADAEDDGQPGGDEEERGRARQAAEGLEDQVLQDALGQACGRRVRTTSSEGRYFAPSA